MRNVRLALELKSRGAKVRVCGINQELFASGGIRVCSQFDDALTKAELIILPLPVSRDGVTLHTPLYSGTLNLTDIFVHAKKTALICGGKMNIELFEEHGLKAVDYASRDDFASLNAVPTCEGAIEAVMKLLPVTIFSSSALVTGFGKTAKVLALTLKAMGAKVTVCARSTRDLSMAEALGMEAVHLDRMHLHLGEMDMIFNTVPHRIFSDAELDAIKPHTPLADLASAPGGLDGAEAKARDIDYLFLPGLPGKYSPVTAAQIILKTITNIIGESGKDANVWIYGENGLALP